MEKKEFFVTKVDYCRFGLKYRYGSNGMWHDIPIVFNTMEEVNEYIEHHKG